MKMKEVGGGDLGTSFRDADVFVRIDGGALNEPRRGCPCLDGCTNDDHGKEKKGSCIAQVSSCAVLCYVTYISLLSVR